MSVQAAVRSSPRSCHRLYIPVLSIDPTVMTPYPAPGELIQKTTREHLLQIPTSTRNTHPGIYIPSAPWFPCAMTMTIFPANAILLATTALAD